MSMFKISDVMSKVKGQTIFEYVQKNDIDKIVTYIVNSDYRKAVHLKSWIKEQVDLPDTPLQSVLDSIKTYEDPDKQMYEVYYWVRKNIKYVPDSTQWNMSEYWQTAEETESLRTGDCEDGAILMYVLARLKGIPANRLYSA